MIANKLGDLIEDTDIFFAEYWAKEPSVFDAPVDFSTLISEKEIWDELDCGLLSRPYFTVFNEGVRAAMNSITTTRKVAGHELAGYANNEQIKLDFENGGTFKLSQAEHWHHAIQCLVEGMKPSFRGNIEAFVFLSPPGQTAMSAHTDGAHVFILQVSGDKNWVVGRLCETSHSDSTLHEGGIEGENRIELTLRPGQVLYMPHGCPHYATAKAETSIHIAITVEEPTSLEMANIILADFFDDPRFLELDANHHTKSNAENVNILRHHLSSFISEADLSLLIENSLKLNDKNR